MPLLCTPACAFSFIVYENDLIVMLKQPASNPFEQPSDTMVGVLDSTRLYRSYLRA